MEFLIDFALVRKLASHEYDRATSEIDSHGILQAFRNSLQRHDSQLAAASDIGTLACKQGCSWCCHFSVDVRPIETFNIVHFINEHFSAEAVQQLRTKLVANSNTLGRLDEQQRMTHNIKCAFLINERCSIYAARPQTCRNYHATDSGGCKLSYEQPDNMDIAPEFAPITFQTGASQVDAFAKAMRDEGFVTDVYELNSAILEALDNTETSWQRFINKESPFGISGDDVPLEFIDMEE